MLREQGTNGVWHALFYATGLHGVYSPPPWRHRASTEQTRRGWEMAVKTEKILWAVLGEVHERKVWHGWE
jgi:hypothetical protein